MNLKEPVVEFVKININESVIVTSDSCKNCAKDGGYTGGGTICYGDMNISTECDDVDAEWLN